MASKVDETIQSNNNNFVFLTAAKGSLPERWQRIDYKVLRLYRFHVEYLIGSGRDQKHSTFRKGMFECSTFQDVEPKERNLHETVTNSKYGSLAALAQGHLNDPTCRLRIGLAI